MLAACLIWSGCKDDMMEENGTFKEGTVTLQFAVQGSQEVETRADGESDGDSRLDNALVFAFDANNNCVAKQWTYLDGGTNMSMYLPSSAKTLCAVCNLLDPETVMNKVSKRADLDAQAVTISEADGAYKGKYVMSGKLDISASSGDSYTIDLTRLAAQFNVTVKFAPSVASDEFMLSEISLHNIPGGSWLFQQNQGTVDGFTREVAEGELGPVATIDGGQKGDYVYSETPAVMQTRFFEEEVLDWEDKVYAEGETKETNEKYAVETTFNIFENRRGTLDKDATTEINGETKSINWPDLQGEENMKEYAQLFKKQLAQNAGFTYATYMAIKGVYRMAGGTDYETTYYVYLGNDNYSDYNVNRNTKYDLTVTIRTVEQADTRVEPVTLGDMKVYYNENEVLDTHFNAVQTLLYSPGKWEMWVENPDENPWLELSREKKYIPQSLGTTTNDGSRAGTRLIGTAGMDYIYVHTDEYVPVIASPQQNAASVRQARIGYRWQNEYGIYSETTYFTVTQYPAQMVVLHIKYDVHTMKEVRDTFYVERVQEKKNLKWGFDKYWSITIDDLIASGMWDGLSNTRKLFQVATEGDTWSEPKYADGIPSDVALEYILDKNRDRNGNGKIDYNEIVWYMPAVYELQALQEALAEQNVTFEGGDDFFFSSTPSSSDPYGVTAGYAWYVKMQNGKSALAQRDRQYNVIALRRKNAWKGPETAGGNVSVDKNDEWDEEEVIMPKY